jgi:hypothetical protein
MQLRGNLLGARRTFAYGQRLSRRDLRAQLWAIEDAVSRNDIPGALRQYDAALRTSRTAPDMLFPVLASAITDAPIRATLARTLRDRPSWGDSFVFFAAARGPDPRATAEFYRRLRQAGVAVTPGAQAVLLQRLVANGEWSEAWEYYTATHPGADRRVSRDPNFSAPGPPSPFDWTLGDDAGITTSIQSGDKGGIFDFAAPPGIGGVLLKQTQMLPPGEYRIVGRSAGVEQPESSRPYWVLNCLNGRELGRVPLPNSTQANGLFSGRFRVPAGCSAQILWLVARPSAATGGVSGQIQQVRLHPIIGTVP